MLHELATILTMRCRNGGSGGQRLPVRQRECLQGMPRRFAGPPLGEYRAVGGIVEPSPVVECPTSGWTEQHTPGDGERPTPTGT